MWPGGNAWRKSLQHVWKTLYTVAYSSSQFLRRGDSAEGDFPCPDFCVSRLAFDIRHFRLPQLHSGLKVSLRLDFDLIAVRYDALDTNQNAQERPLNVIYSLSILNVRSPECTGAVHPPPGACTTVWARASGVRDVLPRQFDPVTNRTIELIDVLWLKRNTRSFRDRKHNQYEKLAAQLT